jgi:hypothetical protein
VRVKSLGRESVGKTVAFLGLAAPVRSGWWKDLVFAEGLLGIYLMMPRPTDY